MPTASPLPPLDGRRRLKWQIVNLEWFPVTKKCSRNNSGFGSAVAQNEHLKSGILKQFLPSAGKFLAVQGRKSPLGSRDDSPPPAALKKDFFAALMSIDNLIIELCVLQLQKLPLLLFKALLGKKTVLIRRGSNKTLNSNRRAPGTYPPSRAYRLEIPAAERVNT